MARKDINTLSLYPSDELMQSLKEFKDLGDYKSLSAAAIAILSQHLISNPESTVQSTILDESPSLSTVQTKVQSTVLDELKAEIRQLTSRVETLEHQSTLLSTVQSTLSSESDIQSTVQTKVQNTVLDQQRIVEPEPLPIIDAIEALPVTVTDTTIEAVQSDKPIDSNALSDAIATTGKALKITYSLNRDGSVILQSLRGITVKELKKMNDQQLKEVNLFKSLVGLNDKFFPIDYPAKTAQTKLTNNQSQSTSTNISSREHELCTLPKLSLGEAYELAKLRDFEGTEDSFNKNFDTGKYASKYQIEKLPDKEKIQKTDKNGNPKTFNVRVYKNSKQWVSE